MSAPDSQQAEPLLSPATDEETASSSSASPLTTAQHARALDADTEPESTPLGRRLGWRSAYIIVLSRVIGTGIFATPGAVVRSAGSVGLSSLLWVLGAVMAACGLAVSLEYGCMLPRSGADKVYLEFTYRRPRFLASTLVAVQMVLMGFTATNCVVFGEYVLYALGVEGAEWATKALAVGLLAAVTVLHGCFLRAGIWLQNVIGWLKIGLIVFMAVTGLVVVLFGHSSAPEEEGEKALPAKPHGQGIWEGSEWGWGIMSTALFKVSYAYAGADNVNYVLNEVKDPVRTLRSVSIAALASCCVFYLILNFAYFAVVPIDEIKETGELVAALFFDKIFGPTLGKVVLPLAVALCAAGNVLVVTFSKSRANQEIARQGFLPFASLLASSRPFGAPLGGMIVHFIPSSLVILVPPSSDVFDFILDVDGYPIQYFALAVCIGLLLLRSRRPDIKRPFKAWLPAVWIRMAICVALIVAPFFPPRDGAGDVSFFYATYALVGIGVMVSGFVYWCVWFRWLPKRRGYQIEETVEVLEDGTSITKLVRIKSK
ncbi:amino acid/polyamine transporter I [Lineolata rhizophorae]|uniref:Amino acid/polyamine transporter I n=1 Tax=Lineolata rhizophorae TaxID=578093 RepID=A0A6A6PDP7_9PEZI|nr:amino acid/polyamine transporter I [Lineolata rhizophorae]